MDSPAKCPICKAPLTEDRDSCFKPPPECPYKGTSYPELCSLHDKIYFSKWRKMTADVYDIKRGYGKIKRLLAKVKKAAWDLDFQPAKLNVKKAYGELGQVNLDDDPFIAVRMMDRALSYTHHSINDLLHEKGEKPHRPSDFENLYDIILPFKEDW